MSRFAASFATGLLSGGMREYIRQEGVKRQDEKDEMLKEEFGWRREERQRKKLDEDALRNAFRAKEPTGASQDDALPPPGIAQQITSQAAETPTTLVMQQGAQSALGLKAVDATMPAPAPAPAAPTAPAPSATGSTSQLAQQLGAAPSRDSIIADFRQPPTGPQPSMLKQGQQQPFKLDDYMKTTRPAVIKTLLEQGRVDEAEKFTKFFDSQEGRGYTQAWAGGMRSLTLGDTNGALRQFEPLYNNHLPDGNTIKLVPVEGPGDQFDVVQYGPDGKTLGQRRASGQQIAESAALFLSPAEAEKYFADEQSKREAEAARLRALVMNNNSAEKRVGMQITGANQRQAAVLAGKDAERQAELAQATAKANAAVAEFRRQNPDATPEQIEAVRTGVIPAVPTTDGSAPAQVKLAEALVKAKIYPDMKSALQRATQSQDFSPEKIRATAYLDALKANFGNSKKAKEAADSAMRDLFPDQAPGGVGAPPINTIASDPRAVAIRDDKKLTLEQKKAKLRELGYQ